MTRPVGCPGSAPDTARAWLASLEAVSLGYLGDRAALKHSMTPSDISSQPSPGACLAMGVPVRVRQLASYKAITASRLALAEIATQAFDQARAARSPKQAAIVAIEHARAVASSGDLDQACVLAVAAYDIGCRYQSERVCHAVRGFRAGLGGRRRTG